MPATAAPTLTGSASRQPAHFQGKRVPGLCQRTTADGRVVYEAYWKANGSPVRRALSASTTSDAIQELRALRVDHARGEQHRSATGVSFRYLANDYVAHHRARRDLAARTIDLNEQRLRKHVFPVIGSVPANELTARDLRRLIDKLVADGSLGGSSIVQTINVVSAVLQFGIREGLVARNVRRDLVRGDLPSAKRASEPRWLDQAQVQALLTDLGKTEFKTAAACCVYAGLRASEALGLTWADVDLSAGTIAIEKQLSRDGERVPLKTAASAAVLPLVPALVAELRSHRARQAARSFALVRPEQLVFTTRTGKPQSQRNLHRAVANAAANVGLGAVSVHDLRDTFVACAFGANLTLPEVSAFARHSSSRVTAECYAGLADTTRETLAVKLVANGFGS